MKAFAREKQILPEYPRTLHLPWKPNASRDDVVASEDDAKIIFTATCYVQEKIDGANCAMALVGGNTIIRNREFILCKGYKKDTPAKKQFAPIFTWFYENKKKFEALHEIVGFPVSVYGEWMYAQHGLEYDRLPSLFIAYDLYDYLGAKEGWYMNPGFAMRSLEEAGFATVPTLLTGVDDYEELEALANAPSPFTTKGKREGIYLKVCDAQKVFHRFKMVRQDFVRGANWSHDELKRNTLL